MLARGDRQHDVAAHFRVNAGRIAEISTGEKFADVKPAMNLPTPLNKGRFVDPNAPLHKQQEMFEALLKNPPENSRTIAISPQLAAWILDKYNNKGNRKRKPARIRRYAEAMDRGEWLLTGEPLIFGVSCNCLDGQNRLASSVRSGKTFLTDVRFGISDEAFIAINSGKSRTSGDAFYTASISDHEIVAPAVRWLMLYRAGNVMSRASFSNQEMFEFYREKVDEESLSQAVACAKKAGKAVPRGALAAHFYLFEKKHPATMKRLAADFDKNQRGARKLMQFLEKARKQNLGRLNDLWINALLIQVWNAYRAGRLVTAKDLKWNETKEYPAIA
jgi:hypothetical protein